MKTAKYFLILNGIILLTYSFSFFVKPELLGELVGFTHHSPNTLVEITAFYGGLELGLAIFLIWSAIRAERQYFGLMGFAFIFFTAGLARLLGIILYGFEDPSQPIVTAIELVFAAFAIYLSRKTTSYLKNHS